MERSVYRIIDVNFNRGREALRVMEEYCRFVLNSSVLSGRTKNLRHQLCAAIERLDMAKVVASRDSAGDVGRGLGVKNQLVRESMRDCFVAGAKRLPEALRALSEVVQIIDGEVSAVLENLRFEAYTLEKDVMSFSSVYERVAAIRLYVLITCTNDNCENVIELAKECAQGGADCIQLRPKGLDDGRIYELGCELAQTCKDMGVLSIINDRVDIAVACGADGVHFGQGDLPIEAGRKLQLKPMIMGVSTHNLEQLDSAIASGADYVGLGPCFATGTKPETEVAGLDYIQQAIKRLKDTGIGHVAIGGIGLDNLDQVTKTGANAVAICSAVQELASSRENCRHLKKKLLP